MPTTDGQGAILYCERVESRMRYFFLKLKAVHYSSVAMSMDALSERYPEFLFTLAPSCPLCRHIFCIKHFRNIHNNLDRNQRLENGGRAL